VMSISSKELAFSGIFTLEHLGLLAVLLEVLLLAHVMSYQVGLLHRKRMARVGMVEKVRLLSQLNHRIPGMVYQLERTKQGNLQVRYVSPGVRDLFGLTEADVKLSLTPLLERLHVDDRPQMQSSLAQSAEHMSMWELEFRVMLPRQGTRWLAALAHPERRPDGGVLWHGFMTDITARREAEDSLRHLAEHDPLTGCLNRASMEQMLVSDIAEASLKGQLLSVIMLDLDRFKPVNDRYGHRAGDRLLQVVAERIVAAIRNTDRVARLGGDEFVIILSRITSDADALTIAEKLRRSISQAIVIDEVALHTTASIGVAVFPDHGQNGDDLVEAADRAMYLAKKQGRDSVMLASK
ncbi:MAG: sensor domain-containing diguanylate cyclase, partial [Natronospirillum sp.]